MCVINETHRKTGKCDTNVHLLLRFWTENIHHFTLNYYYIIQLILSCKSQQQLIVHSNVALLDHVSCDSFFVIGKSIFHKFPRKIFSLVTYLSLLSQIFLCLCTPPLWKSLYYGVMFVFVLRPRFVCFVQMCHI